MRKTLAFAAIGGGVYLTPLDWELLLAVFFFGLFALVAFLALCHRDPHRHLDVGGDESGDAS